MNVADWVIDLTERVGASMEVYRVLGGRNPFDPRRVTPIEEFRRIAREGWFEEKRRGDRGSVPEWVAGDRIIIANLQPDPVAREQWVASLDDAIAALREDRRTVAASTEFDVSLDSDRRMVTVEHRASGLKVEMTVDGVGGREWLKVDSRPHQRPTADRYRGLGIGRRVYLRAMAELEWKYRMPHRGVANAEALRLRDSLHRDYPYLIEAGSCPQCDKLKLDGGDKRELGGWAAASREDIEKTHSGAG